MIIPIMKKAVTILMVLDNINLDIKTGEFVVVLGHNGSGKINLAKHFNAFAASNRWTGAY